MIETLLRVPVRHTQNRLRFSCPLCAGFQTSILREKNLSRCFDCGKNFNTIEIVMYHMHIGFVESVNRLKQYQSDLTKQTASIEKRKKLDCPLTIGEIIGDILPPPRQNHSKNPSYDKHAIPKRIDKLEKKFDTLSSQVEKLCRLILSR
ncbi:MAG: hypothetical protein GY841_23205 [FCB group bacterium]|nr:hypothetical protein [FCB group bacterium]